MSWIAVAAVGTVVSVGMQVSAGNQANANAKGQAKAAELEAKVAETGIKQTQARRLEALNADLGAIRAVRATQNVGMSSGSARAAERGYEKDYLRSLRTDILQQRLGVMGRYSSAAGLRAGGRAQQLAGYAGAVSTAVGGFSKFGGTGEKKG